MSDRTIIDPRDLRPRVGDDRRQGPRRAEEAAVHYATEALVAAACGTVDQMLDETVSDEDAEAALVALAESVATFRAAVNRAQAAR